MEFQGPMAPAEVSTIEVVAPTVGAEEPLTSEKVQKLKVAEVKVELQRNAWSKNGNKAVLCNRILEAVVNIPPMFNSRGEGNEAGGTQVTFPNPEDGWIPGSRWREMRLNKDPLEEIIEVVFRTPTTQEDFRVLPQKKYKFSEIFDRPVFAEKLAVWETTKVNNSLIHLDGRGNPRYFSKGSH